MSQINIFDEIIVDNFDERGGEKITTMERLNNSVAV